ncbi:MAG: hypothetical protein LLG44_04745 [Chloroflexi bacterium]|nr:hypothetical protein [Chloroflexota bacterium]
MSEQGIINIINFIRACEPRDLNLDLVEPVARQIELVQAHHLAATWLLQYDALTDERFVALLKERLDERQEVGIWFEVMQPLVEKAGLTWRGRFPWDWHAHVGFSIGYTPQERERLADVALEEFKRIWGYYPASVGSWLLDAHLLGYLADRYHISAACLCKDQWGTDGYTLWGGYYSQAYYPSRANAFMPAQSAVQQIPVPVFRMLGSDPIYQYDVAATENGQQVITLEPVYAGNGGGGAPQWVRWFMRTTYEAPALSFGYAQMGQENSFGWPAMRAGLTDQLALAADWAAQGKLRVETLGDSGRWYHERYANTPASAITALEDWRGQGRASVWYGSRYYRINWFWENGRCWIRDIHLFDEHYPERYLNGVCPAKDCTYDTLPVVDGLLWGARLEFIHSSADGATVSLIGGQPEVTEQDANTLVIRWPLNASGEVVCICLPERIKIKCSAHNWGMQLVWQAGKAQELRTVQERSITFEHAGYGYRIICAQGRFVRANDANIVTLIPENGVLELVLAAQE